MTSTYAFRVTLISTAGGMRLRTVLVVLECLFGGEVADDVLLAAKMRGPHERA